MSTRAMLPPPAVIAERVAALQVGESAAFGRDVQTGSMVADSGINVTFTKLDAATLERQLQLAATVRHPDPYYEYDGSGTSCPVCRGAWVLIKSYTSSDGFCGIERGTWLCLHCSLQKDESYEGYGSIFGRASDAS